MRVVGKVKDCISEIISDLDYRLNVALTRGGVSFLIHQLHQPTAAANPNASIVFRDLDSLE